MEAALILNETINSTLTQTTSYSVDNATFNVTESELCKPRYFIFNSQVKLFSRLLRINVKGKRRNK